ncbi:MAG: hypothetical protein L3J26_13455 [Candidatus Polarisedimenticolaceae bacterium]|nr:hypothetical protein [Candidatus Polarisedimenticolaceae bacterium]
MERCPICRGRIMPDAQCGRCGADLTLSLQAETEAVRLTKKALCHIEEDDIHNAEKLLNRALALKNDPLPQALLVFIKRR